MFSADIMPYHDNVSRSVSCIYHVQYHADIMPYHDNVSRSVSCIYHVCITKWYHVPYHVVIRYHILIRYHVVIRKKIKKCSYHVGIFFMIRTFLIYVIHCQLFLIWNIFTKNLKVPGQIVRHTQGPFRAAAHGEKNVARDSMLGIHSAPFACYMPCISFATCDRLSVLVHMTLLRLPALAWFQRCSIERACWLTPPRRACCHCASD